MGAFRNYFVIFVALLNLMIALVNTAQPPNIIILYSDDMGYGDFGCYGHPTIRTPNIDRMAAEGLKFTQFYTAYPICSPSRAALLTGRYPIRSGIYSTYGWPEDNLFRVFTPWSLGGLPMSEITIADALKTRGYNTALIGKWHLGHVNDSFPTRSGGFDYFYGLTYSHEEGCPPGKGFECNYWQKMWPGIPLYENDQIIEQPVDLQALTPRYNKRAVDFITNNANNGTPFFLYLAWEQTHIPLFANEKFFNTSKRGLYGDNAQEMDDSVGQVLNAVRSLGISNNTFVFYSSDNGPIEQTLDGGSAGPFQGGKGSTWEGGLREPGIAWWPGKIKPGLTMEVSTTMDLFNTALDLAGVPIPKDRIIDGKSMLPLFSGTGKIGNDYLFFWRDDVLYAVRHGAYKAHFYTRDGFGVEPPVAHDPPLLFNVEHDPGEKFAISSNSASYKTQMALITSAVKNHLNNLVKGKSQFVFDLISQKVAPCCNKQTNCVCGYNATNMPFNDFVVDI